MSAVNLLSSLREKPNDEKQKDGSNQQGHEENGVSSGGGDPAVLAVGPARKPLTYTRDELMKLRNSPLVKRNLDKAFAGCDALSLVLKKRSESPNEEDRGAKGDAPNENHNSKGVYSRGGRAADPRERVRRESETAGGIVLSPQRRSFTSGCGAPAPRPASPPPPAQNNANAHQKTEQAGRRIGSGRIMVREPGGATWEEPEYRPEPYRPPRERQNNDRYDRRSFSRDSFPSDLKRERDDRFINDKRDRDEPRRNNRYNNRRYDKEEEPEWFSGGPTSQLETIELRGFDDPPKKNGNTSDKETDKRSNSGGSRSPSERWRETSSPLSQPTVDSVNTSNDKDSGVESKTEDVQQNNDQPEFNLDEFLKFDTIPDVLTNGGSETEGGSRFSRWFRRESPTNDKHYERLLHNIVDELENSPPREVVFAPIAPAAPAPAPPPPPPPSLLDLLLRANDARPDATSMGGKVHSLEELEARLRPQPVHHHNVPDHDLTAFKRLLAQVSGGHAVAAGDPPRHQPMTLLQMLNKSMEQQQQQQQQQQQKAQQQQQQQPHIPQELLYKLLQIQQQTNSDDHPSHPMRQQQTPEMSNHSAVLTPSDRELLQRPEAQAIVHGLKAGEITVQHLMQQLCNPGLQSRHREILLTILRIHHQQRQMSSPLPCGVGPHLAPPLHQPLRLSPLPHQGSGPARIPSPRELAAHTQSIMHSALIKKKLEEQRENYRRRQEIQQMQQHHAKQSTPISFTPTSVLRKMTAEKESDSPNPKQQQWQANKMPQGRPIVKGNQSGPIPINYNPVSNEYQHYMNQQQQMPGNVRQFPIQQQRQQGPNTYNNMNNMNRGMSGGTTLHQLLVQSHQRSMNEMSNNGAGSAGGDNQLARWFSPELLARASAGKLPSVHVPNALSLEDLERHHAPTPPVRN